MKSDQWFAVKRDKNTKVIYIMTGGDRCMVKATAKGMFRDPIIVKLTWMMMKVLTGCAIPADKPATDFCRGEIMLPPNNNRFVIIKAL